MSEKISPLQLTIMPRLSGSENHRGYMLIDQDGYQVATVIPFDADGIQGLAYANRIVTAANAFPKLVEALECLLELYADEIGLTIEEIKAGSGAKAKAALKLAKGEPHD